jgi:hypothetical protein
VMLGDGSPVPYNEPALGEWASALDPTELFIDPGILRKLCVGEEPVRSGFRRRLVETRGVVASADDEIGTELTYYERAAPPVPKEITVALRGVRAKEAVRPDGEVLLTPLDEVRCARQLAAGFYSRWRYPHGEPPELIDEWFLKRQNWNRELREKLKGAGAHLDSDKLCRNAAERWLNGGCPGCERGAKELHQKGCREVASHPLWDSYCWPAWRDIEDKVYHETETVWMSDFLLNDAARWALDGVGIVWVEHVEFGHELSRRTKLPYYGEGEAAARGVALERGARSVILSIRANSEGLNLQCNDDDGSARFSRNLFVTFPSDAKTAGQAVGRTHRPKQVADEVECFYFAHTVELRDGIGKAQNKAAYSSETTGAEHKLAAGTWVPLKASSTLGRG